MNDFTPQLVPDDEKLKSINDLVVKLLEHQQKVSELEFMLKEEKDKLRRIEEGDLPEALTLVGYQDGDKVKLSGVEVKLKTDMQMSISAAKKPFVLSWLKEKGHGDIIKNDLNINIPKGAAEESLEEVKHIAQELGFSYEQIENVNTATVKSLLKGLLKDGEVIAIEDLGGRMFTKATIKF